HELRVSVDGSLTYLERYALAPGSRQLRHSWRAGAASYLGTTIVQSDNADAARAEDAQQRLDAIDGVRAGVDCPAPQLVVGRLLATRGPQFASARTGLRDRV